MKRVRVIASVLALLFAVLTSAQERKVMNRPYIDMRQWHYGFLVGFHTQDVDLSNNMYIYNGADADEQWCAQVASYSPGFSVGVLGEFRLGEYAALRVIPTMHFGDHTVLFREQNTQKEAKQVIKSTYLSVPVDLKVSAPRFNNYRPYVMAGLSPQVDLTIKKQKELLLERSDLMFEVGLGMDLYYPYFKLIPELKFCFGLRDILNTDRMDLTDPAMLKYTSSLNGASNRMIVLTLYFE